MKKLAYFLVLFVGINVYAQDRVGTGGGGDGSRYAGGSTASEGDVYLQIMHWRTFAVAYGSRCFQTKVSGYGQDERGNKVPVVSTVMDPSANARLKPFLSMVNSYFRSDSGGSEANQKVRHLTGLHRGSGGGGGDGGGAYGTNENVDMCAVRLGQAYHNLSTSQGDSSFCGAYRAKYDQIISDTNIGSLKSKARSAVSSGAFNRGNICSPQSESINFSAQSTSDYSASADPGHTTVAGGGGSGGGGSEEMQATTQNAPAAAPASADKPAGTTATVQATPPAGAAPANAPATTPAAPASGEVQVASAQPTTAAGQRRAGRRTTAATRIANKAKKETGGGRGNGLAVASTGQGVETGGGGAGATPVIQPASNNGSTQARAETAGGGDKQQPAKPQTQTILKEEYKEIFTDSAACKFTNQNESYRHRLAHVDAFMVNYNHDCVKSGTPESNQFTGPYTTAMGETRTKNSLDSIRNKYMEIEKKLSGQKRALYCGAGARTNFFKANVSLPNHTELKTFVTDYMCKK